MGDQADDNLCSFALSEEDQKKNETVRSRFDSHFIKRQNIIFEGAKFNSRKQEAGETAEPGTAFYMMK